MIKRLILVCLFLIVSKQEQAQNWASVPCFNGSDGIRSAVLDTLHNEIVLSFYYDYNICNKNFKGILGYNESGFHELDFGLNAYDTSNPYTGGDQFLASATFINRTLYGGYFASVGSEPIYSEGLALWNGAIWDTFPKFTFTHNPSRSGGFPTIYGFFQDNGKLWINGQFDNLGGVPGKNLYTFNGTTFVPYSIPVSDFDQVRKIIRYKNDLIVIGVFYDYPSYSISKLAKFNGATWSSIGAGVRGGLASAADIVVYKDTLYVAGSFRKEDGNAGNYIMKSDGTQLMDAGFGGFYGWNYIKKLVVFRNRLYAFGSFNMAADEKAFNIAYYENGKWTVPKDSINGSIDNVVEFNNELYIASAFTIYHTPPINHFARLRCPDFDATSGCLSGLSEKNLDSEVRVFPNPTTHKLKIEMTSGNIQSIYFTNILGQIIKEISPESKEVDVSSFHSGIYFLFLQVDNHKKIIKVIKE